jgi:hypothetical protein
MAKRGNNFNQGIFPIGKLKNPQKYVGKNKNQIVFRSGWEKIFILYCDKDPSILEWSSEEIVINYLFQLENPPRSHRYFPDFYIKYKNKDNKIIEAIIEIKPYKETIKPVITEKMQKKTKAYLMGTWIKNQNKWASAREFCRDKRWKFFVLTEKDLKIYS